MKVLYFSIAKLCYSKICLWHQLLYIFPRKYCSIASTASGFEAPTSQSFESPSKGTRLYISSSLTIFFTFVCCYSSTVWPDWVIFESSCATKFVTKIAQNDWQLFGQCWKTLILCTKLLLLLFGQLLETFGLLFTTTSGHTVEE